MLGSADMKAGLDCMCVCQVRMPKALIQQSLLGKGVQQFNRIS